MWSSALAVVDDRSIAVDSKIAGLVSAAQEDQNAKDLLLNRLDLLTMLAHLIEKSRSRIEGEIATDLGFGMSFGSAKLGPPDQGGRLAITMGGEVPVLPAKRPAPTGSRVEVTSLQNEEQIEKARWAARLRQIAQKAGDAAKINDTSCMPGVSRAEQGKLKAIVFEAGGHRTIRQNVRAWEKFEEWAARWFLSVYPPDTSTVTKYCLYLSQEGCGPAVIPSFKYAVGWICRRLVMTPPDLKSGGIVAIEEKVHTDRGKELKEAIPISLHLVGALEHLLVYQSPDPNKEASTVFLFWILILIYGSLRFDDGKHVSPSSIIDSGTRRSLWLDLADEGREEKEGNTLRCSEVFGIGSRLVLDRMDGFSAFSRWSGLFHLGFEDWEGVRSGPHHLHQIYGLDEVPVHESSGPCHQNQVYPRQSPREVREGDPVHHMAFNEGHYVVSSGRGWRWRQGHWSSGQLEGPRSTGPEVRQEEERSLGWDGQELGGSAQGTVEAGSGRVHSGRSSGHRGTGSDRVCAQEQRVGSQDHGRWCEVPHFPPGSQSYTDFVWEAGDRRLLVFWSGASRRCVQDLPG